MNRIFALLVLYVAISLSAFAYNFQTVDLTAKIELIEKTLNTYSDESLSVEDRLKNAEDYVFGVAKSGNINDRINELYKVLGITFNTNQEKEKIANEIKSNEKTNYPAVNSLEKQVFGKTYEAETIYDRLDRLEKKVIGKSSEKSLNERLSALQEKLKPELQKHNSSEADDIYNSNDYNYYSPKNNNEEISILEKKLFGKNFENEDINNRISRLEFKLFGKNFDSEREDNRVERIKSVYKAAKSGTEYKVNKFAKYAFAGAQIGGILLLILAMIL